jgi:2-iminobutanoate/2-iminopropanoate deaminase
MAKREQINWEIFPEEHKDDLMQRHLYYVPGVIVSNVTKQIYVSGQNGLRKDSQGRVLNEGDLEDQTIVALEKIKTILANAGATLNDVVQVTVFLRDASDRDKHAEIRAKYFKEKQPASTLVGTDFIFKEMLVEINAIAAI